MKLTIEMSLDNAAFEDGGTDELKRAVSAALEKMRGHWADAGGAEANIRDINGNKCGTARIEE